MKSAFEHKPELRLSEFVIEKTVRIPDEDFEKMLRRPMDGQPFIAENMDLMYQDDDDVFHCILVTGTDRTDGILVESEGYGYARYASYVPEISALGYPSLVGWNRKLMSAADLIMEAGINRSESSKWRLTYEELEKQTGLCLKEQPFLRELLRDMLLCDRRAVSELCLGDDTLEVMYNPDFYLRGSEAQVVPNTKFQF
ncbi:MAG: hypothetical protein KHY76_01425 [Butyricicoccus pullicaecorum]|nr:hypothetical protein [Butyricicoccus pullicaecorum]